MRALIAVAVLALPGIVQAQGCFGPVVAGECHDAQSEMRRMQEFQRQANEQARQTDEFVQQSQERRSRRDLETRIAELEAETQRFGVSLKRLSVCSRKRSKAQHPKGSGAREPRLQEERAKCPAAL